MKKYKKYVEKGWTKEEVVEAMRHLLAGETCIIFKGGAWDWRMLKRAVDEERERLEEGKIA